MRHVVYVLSVLWLATPLHPLTAAEPVTLHCTLWAKDEVKVPAQEPGVLDKLPVREGQEVAEGDVLAQIDDIVPAAKLDIARYKLKVAERQAKDRVEVDYADFGYYVAAKELDRSMAAIKRTPKSVSDDDIDKQRLEREKFRLALEKAKKDCDIAGLQKEVSEAELRAAEADVKRRKLIAPIRGVVIELNAHQGEWVQAGETVMKLVRVDLLNAKGTLSAKDFHSSEIQGRPVQVTVSLSGGQRKTFPGKIVFVSPVVKAGDVFEVWAELQNPEQGNSWVLSPGLKADMTIQLK